jgi:myo-inositol-1(or 4)-monophosphatase
MPIRSPIMNVMVRAAEKTGRALLRDFGEIENLQVSMKGPADFVSNADIKADKMLREELSKARPGYGFLTEEGKDEKGEGEYTWIIDPLDGTSNFLHAIPHWAVSLALAKSNEIVAGVVYNPVSDELFWSEKGIGAFVNSKRLRVSGRRDLHTALIGTGIPFKGTEVPGYINEMQNVMSQVAGIRRMGVASLDLAFLAAGRFDGFWEHNLKPWDIAAGVLLVREAGGFVRGMKKGEDPIFTGNIVASNDVLQTKLCGLLGIN